MTQETVTIQCADGESLTGTLFVPSTQPRGTVLIASALGTPRKVYAGLASFLAQNDYLVLTFDYRATFDSRGAGNGQSNLRDWGEQDIDAGLGWLRERHPGVPMIHMGHSVGAQLFGLAGNSEHLAAAVLITPSLPHLSRFPLKSRLGIAAIWKAVIPLLSLGRERFPAQRVGLSNQDMPVGAMRQWANWASDRQYLFAPTFGLDTSRYGKFDRPVLTLGFSDDDYAPANVVDAFLERLPNAEHDRRIINVAEAGVGAVGHAGYFRDKLRDSLWQDTLDWLNDRVGSAQEPR